MPITYKVRMLIIKILFVIDKNFRFEIGQVKSIAVVKEPIHLFEIENSDIVYDRLICQLKLYQTLFSLKLAYS